MFIKVDGDNPSLFEVPNGPNSVEYGSRVVTKPPWEVDWSEELGVAFGFVHYRGDKIPPFDPPREATGEIFQPFWVVHWAWWAPYDDRISGVVTTHPLYILNGNGKTIDRVR